MWNLSSVFHSFLFGPRTGLPFLSVHCALRLSRCQLLRCRRGAGQVSHCLLWQAALPTGGRAGLPVPCSSSSWTRLLPSVSALTGERSVSDTSDFWAQTQEGPALLPCRLRKLALGTNAAQVRRPRSRPVFGLLSGSDTLILICSFGQESVWGCDGKVQGVQLGLSCWNSSGCVGPHADQGGSVATVSAATGSTATPVVDSGAVTATATWTHCETGLDQDSREYLIPRPRSQCHMGAWWRLGSSVSVQVDGRPDVAQAVQGRSSGRASGRASGSRSGVGPSHGAGCRVSTVTHG